MKAQTFKEAYQEYMKERQSACNHQFVDAYDVSTCEAYKRCSCGLEKDRRKMSEEDAARYLGIIDKMSAKGETKRRWEQLSLPLEGSNG